MQKQIMFPIKGVFYYDAATRFHLNQLNLQHPLQLKPEPSNPFDAFALQIWQDDALLGYVPRKLTPTLAQLPQLQLLAAPCHLMRIQLKGQFLYLECQLSCQLNFWQSLKLLWLSTYVTWQYRLKSWFFTRKIKPSSSL